MTRRPRRGSAEHTSVVVVGAGFAGIGCAKALAKHDVPVVLIDKHNYHQFQPLLYQVATGQLAPSDVAAPLRTLLRHHRSVDVKQDEVVSVDPERRSVTTAEGRTYTGEYLVVAAGSRPQFYRVAGAAEHAFPLYSLMDAERLRSRVFALFEEADRDPQLMDQGALTFVVVGAGATGVETAGALADLVNDVLPHEYRDLDVRATRIHLLDHGHAVLGPFSPEAHDYAAKVLQRRGVRLGLGTTVREVTPRKVVLGDGTEIATRCAVWAGGVQAEDLAGEGGLDQGRGGRVDVEHDLTVDGYPGVFVLGDMANIPDPHGDAFPQLGSVALQSGQWTARNILAQMNGKSTAPFRYHDKGVMAMIGRNAAVAELGPKRHELHGAIAFASWLGVHAWLMSGVRGRVDAFISWGWDYFSGNREPGLVDRPDVARIDWDEDERAQPGVPPPVPRQSGTPPPESERTAAVARTRARRPEESR